MGGVFSGNRSCRGGKLATSSLPEVRLTHRQLFSIGSTATPGIRPEADGWATVTYGAMQWPVLLESTPLHFGGERRWLICAMCSKRRQVLHIRGKALACRTCLGLRYESQHENRRSRMFRRLEKLRQKLGWQPGVLVPYGVRPRGMHAQTYGRLRAEAEQLTEFLLFSINDWANEAEAALKARG